MTKSEIEVHQKIIIFDGPDMCGKTQMAQFLSKKIGVPYFKNSRERKFFENDPGYFVKALKYGDPYFVSYLKQTGASVILDRSYPSEFVYSKVFNRQTSDDILRLVDTMYNDVGAKIIVPYRTTYENIKDDSFSEIDSDVLIKLDETYQAFCKWTSCDILRLCVDSENLEKEMEEIIPFLDK